MRRGQHLPSVEGDPPTKLALQLQRPSEAFCCGACLGQLATSVIYRCHGHIQLPMLRGSPSEASFRPPVSGTKSALLPSSLFGKPSSSVLSNLGIIRRINSSSLTSRISRRLIVGELGSSQPRRLQTSKETSPGNTILNPVTYAPAAVTGLHSFHCTSERGSGPLF